jgi:predicted ferric reductase
MIKPKNKLGIVLFLILAHLPLLILYTYQPAFYYFSDFYGGATTIAKIFGLSGVMYLAIDIFMSARYHFLEHLFGGLDYVYTIHRKIGKWAYTFLLLHVLFMGLRYIPFSWQSVADFYLDTSSLYLIMGKAAIALFTLVIGITIYVRLPYHILKFIHRFMGVVLFLGGAHAYLVPSDITIVYPLRVYILTWVVLGLISYLHRSWLGGFLFRKYRYSVVQVNPLEGDVTEVVMKPQRANRKIRNLGGQFQFIRFFQPGFSSEEHPFTVSSGEDEKFLRLSIKNSGDFTSNIGQLKRGAQAISEGPFGGFTYGNASFKDQVWIAGGIGITPFLSMSRTLGKKKDFGGYNVSLFYTYEEPKDAVFVRELKNIARGSESFKVHPICSSKEGRLTVERILETVGSFEGNEIYICGPWGMIEAFRDRLMELGVKKKYIRYEEFRLL